VASTDQLCLAIDACTRRSPDTSPTGLLLWPIDRSAMSHNVSFRVPVVEVNDSSAAAHRPLDIMRQYGSRSHRVLNNRQLHTTRTSPLIKSIPVQRQSCGTFECPWKVSFISFESHFTRSDLRALNTLLHRKGIGCLTDCRGLSGTRDVNSNLLRPAELLYRHVSDNTF
jgi:hypothetical protein